MPAAGSRLRPAPVAASRAPASSDALGAAIVVALVLAVLQRLVGFGRAVLTCAWLGPEELGRWDMAFSFLTLAAPLAMFSLPGVFGRFVEHYRLRDQAQPFVRGILAVVGVLALLAAALLVVMRATISWALFGGGAAPGLVGWLALALLATMLLYALGELLTALRLQRLASVVMLVQSVVFAAGTVAVLAVRRADAVGVLAAYTMASAVALVPAARWAAQAWRDLPPAADRPGPSVWARVLPFAAWLWITNALDNLFALVDRTMLLHVGAPAASAALEQIGQYHSARLVSLLLLNLSAMLGALLTPYLSRQWEAGQGAELVAHLGLMFKLTTLGLVAASVGALAVAPPVFETAFGGRFQAGLAVLPAVLVGCAWAGMAHIARTYLWCAERTSLWCLAVGLGLVANVGLNLVLLPRFGMPGVVASTAIAQLVILATVLACDRALGLRLEASVWVVALPVVILLGPLGGSAAVLAIAVLGLTTGLVLRPAEKRALAALAGGRWRAWTRGHRQV